MHDRRGYNTGPIPIQRRAKVSNLTSPQSKPRRWHQGFKVQMKCGSHESVNPQESFLAHKPCRVSIYYLQGGPDSSKWTKNDWLYRHMLAGGCCASSV